MTGSTLLNTAKAHAASRCAKLTHKRVEIAVSGDDTHDHTLIKLLFLRLPFSPWYVRKVSNTILSRLKRGKRHNISKLGTRGQHPGVHIIQLVCRICVLGGTMPDTQGAGQHVASADW